MDIFKALRLLRFSAVRDDGKLYTDIVPNSVSNDHYACGIFEFSK